MDKHTRKATLGKTKKATRKQIDAFDKALSKAARKAIAAARKANASG